MQEYQTSNSSSSLIKKPLPRKLESDIGNVQKDVLALTEKNILQKFDTSDSSKTAAKGFHFCKSS